MLRSKEKPDLIRKLIADGLNSTLKPLEKIYGFLRKTAARAKEKFPAAYKYFEGIIKQHIITPSKELFKSSKIEDMGSFITTNVMKRLPHIDELQVEEILHNPSNSSFLEILTKGLGINRNKQRTYTVLKKNGFTVAQWFGRRHPQSPTC